MLIGLKLLLQNICFLHFSWLLLPTPFILESLDEREEKSTGLHFRKYSLNFQTQTHCRHFHSYFPCTKTPMEKYQSKIGSVCLEVPLKKMDPFKITFHPYSKITGLCSRWISAAICSSTFSIIHFPPIEIFFISIYFCEVFFPVHSPIMPFPTISLKLSAWFFIFSLLITDVFLTSAL